jgi:hypothetical protein
MINRESKAKQKGGEEERVRKYTVKTYTQH